MKTFKLNTIVVAFSMLLLFVTDKAYSQLDSIIHMRFSQVAPNLGEDLKLESYDTTIIDVFNHNKIRLFQFQFSMGIYENNLFVRKEKRIQYFIQFKDSLTGYFTDSILGFINVKQKRDSVSILNMAFNDAIETDFKTLKMELYETERNVSNYNLIEKFKVYSQFDTANPAIWKLTYDMSNNKWPLSLSSYLDNQKAGHLTEIDLFSPQKFIKSLKVQVDAYHFTHKLQYLGISNDEKILNRMKNFESFYK